MARRVFFSFHYEKDNWRAGQVRNSWVTKEDRESAGFWDAADWEEVKKKGDEAIKAWIRKQMDGTSVTIVLIGAETATRPYVQYEIQQSWVKGNGLIGIYVHNQKDKNGQKSAKGVDPFVALGFSGIRTYDWVDDDGYNNLSSWIEAAYSRALQRKNAS
ncbi:MAG: TIR domain-containing protein [Alphaproteobacteria bacterium]|nr:TIR domain-containing protein [Alphaproteobacteria bacterium]